MVRVASLKAQVDAGISKKSIDGLTPKEQLRKINSEIKKLTTLQENYVNNEFPNELKEKFNLKIALHFKAASELYEDLLAEGIAKECARFVLPLATPTRIYMSGSCRSWIHYIHLRSANGTQEEHKSIAQNCKSIFKKSFPIVSKSLDW